MNFLVFHVGCRLLNDLEVLFSCLIDSSLFLNIFVHLQIHYMNHCTPSTKKLCKESDLDLIFNIVVEKL